MPYGKAKCHGIAIDDSHKIGLTNLSAIRATNKRRWGVFADGGGLATREGDGLPLATCSCKTGRDAQLLPRRRTELGKAQAEPDALALAGADASGRALWLAGVFLHH